MLYFFIKYFTNPMCELGTLGTTSKPDTA